MSVSSCARAADVLADLHPRKHRSHRATPSAWYAGTCSQRSQRSPCRVRSADSLPLHSLNQCATVCSTSCAIRAMRSHQSQCSVARTRRRQHMRESRFRNPLCAVVGGRRAYRGMEEVLLRGIAHETYYLAFRMARRTACEYRLQLKPVLATAVRHADTVGRAYVQPIAILACRGLHSHPRGALGDKPDVSDLRVWGLLCDPCDP
jgi:hypothetical protein